MTLPYLFRLLCLCLGCFFAVHLAAGFAVALCARRLVRLAPALKPRSAGRLLLASRLFPPAAAALTVLALCAPSYLWLEPRTGFVEEVGVAFLAAAAGGAVLWGVSLGRVLSASIRSWLYLRRIDRRSTRSMVAGIPVWIVDQRAPQVMLAGIFRPRTLVSRSIAAALSHEELEAALLHEQAHESARDNFKRLLLAAAPGLFPCSNFLERAWAQAAEWAADDLAVSGDPERSLSLASALVAVARLGPAPPPHRLATSLLDGAQNLAIRVDRLLAAVPPGDGPRWAGTFWALCLTPLAVAAAACCAHPATLTAFHFLLERLSR